MLFTTFLTDLDETVYPAECGVWEAISARMEEYMQRHLGLEPNEIPSIRKSLYQQYGTTLRGLQVTRHINETEFLAYVHDVPLEKYLVPDPVLRDVLMKYPQKKIIFTNADRGHANRVIRELQLDGCFQDMVDILDIAPYCKPMPESFQIALARTGETDPQKCVFIDDSPRNLSSARALGFYTVQVGNPKPGYLHPDSQAHACIPRLRDLPEVIRPEVSI